MAARDEPLMKRVRTDTQMAKKRRADRIQHQVNRAESKLRLENIERDISGLRDGIQAILSQLGELQRSAGPQRGQSDTVPSALPQERTKEATFRQDPPRPSNPPRSLDEPTMKQPAEGDLPAHPALPFKIDCRCGIQHADVSECLEFRSFTTLYHAHNALSRNLQFSIWIPRNPSLSNYLLQTVTENPLTMMLGSTFRQFQAHDTPTLFGLYFLCYRLFRWRLYPSAETFNDVPPLIRPTSVQSSTPHPVSIDYLPWPHLREYLCLNQNQDSRHSVDMYVKSIRMQWAKETTLLYQSTRGEVELNADLEQIASNIESWTMGSPWTDTFSHLQMFVC